MAEARLGRARSGDGGGRRPTMRPPRLVFPALVLAVCGALATAIRCYTCHEPTSVSDCVTITTCTANQTICKTTLYSPEIAYPFLGDSTVTKSCASKCQPSNVDGIGQIRPVSCCNTDLCNLDGAPGLGGPGSLALALTLVPLLGLRL